MICCCNAFNVKQQHDVFSSNQHRLPRTTTHVEPVTALWRQRRMTEDGHRHGLVLLIEGHCGCPLLWGCSGNRNEPSMPRYAGASIIYAPTARRIESHMQWKTECINIPPSVTATDDSYHLLVYLLLYWKSLLLFLLRHVACGLYLYSKLFFLISWWFFLIKQ